MMAIIRKWIAASVCAVALLGLSLPAAAEEGTGLRRIEGEPVYESFTYIDDGENGIVDIVSPAAYRPVFLADAASMGTELSEPVDLFVQEDKVYIVDRAGGKVIITDHGIRVAGADGNLSESRRGVCIGEKDLCGRYRASADCGAEYGRRVRVGDHSAGIGAAL